MHDPKTTVRYLGYRSMEGGGRKFDFSHALGNEKPSYITIDAPSAFFEGPDRIALQEAVGICYETVKHRLEMDPQSMAAHFNLTLADIAEHRKVIAPGRRR